MAPQLDIARSSSNAPSPGGRETGETAALAPRKINMVGLTRAQLADELKALGLPEKQIRMRVNQLWNGIYNRGLKTFEGITSLSKDLRARLNERYEIARPEVVEELVSVDGTRKWLMRLAPEKPGQPGPEIETVYIPEEGRGTLCISSQVGCTLNCTFCHTGTQKLVRNLTPGEIVGQLLVARDSLNEWPESADQPRIRNADDRMVTNIVMMGMGEPLYNFENVRDALNIVSDGEGLQLSKRRITLSTSGVVPEIPRTGEEIGCMLAISLHASNNETRDKLVPLNKKYPIEELLDACRKYPGLRNAQRITFEYVMLKDVNDSVEDAKALVRLLKGIPSKINLIPFNPWPGSPYECSDWGQIEKFAEVVNRAGYASPVRTPRGRDIMAACGQLKSESVKRRASEKLKERKEAAEL